MRCDTHALTLAPMVLGEARRFVGEHHRHNHPPPVQFCYFAVGVESDGQIVAAGIAGRPNARELCDGHTIEVSRCCTIGVPNTASMIYGALTRAAKALGWRRAVTYTLEDEDGASLKASNWKVDGTTDPRSWATRSQQRPRYETNLFGEKTVPAGPKTRWVMHL